MNPHFETLIDLTTSDHEPEVCPTVSEWAQSALGFTPDPKQKQVLDQDAHRLILCCSRQGGNAG